MVDSVDTIALLRFGKMAKFVNGVDTITMLLIREEILEFVSSVDTITLFQKSVDLRICLLIRTECPCISR